MSVAPSPRARRQGGSRTTDRHLTTGPSS